MSIRLIDKVRVEVRAGKGGDGIVAYTAHKLKRLLGPGLPSGGNGGKGGDVIIESSSGVRSLGSVPHVVQGGDGKNGKKDRENGSPGASMTLKVPLGVAVYSEEGHLIADLKTPNQTALLASGGAGGKGNNRVRPHESTAGQGGGKAKIILELKTIADIGLVGFPNAGKSSLLNLVSKAAPQVAPYPFTTLSPFLGTVHVGDAQGSTITVADLPGLVEDAHLNRGMGHEFLRHIERTHALLFVIDATCRHWNPKETCTTEMERIIEVLRSEVELYDQSLSLKPWGVVVNKLDPEADPKMQGVSKVDDLDRKLMRSNIPSYGGLVAVSAKFGIGRKSLIDLMSRLLATP